MYAGPQRENWISLLPVGGQDGTLSLRFGGSAAASRIHAKTGSLAHVNALSGYALRANGEWLAFSIWRTTPVLRRGDPGRNGSYLYARVASLGYVVDDLGNVAVDQAEASPEGDPRAKYLPQIAAACQRLAPAVGDALGRGSGRWCWAATTPWPWAP